MKKFEDFTPQQVAAIPVLRDEYLKIGLATGEADMEVVEPILTDWYRRIGKTKPLFLRLSSPMMAQLVLNLLHPNNPDSQLNGRLDSRIGSQLRNQLDIQLYIRLAGQLSRELNSLVFTQLSNQLYNQINDEIHDQFDSQLVSQLGNQLGSQLHSQLYGQLYNQLHSQLDNQLDRHLYNQLDSQIYSRLAGQLYGQLLGQLDSQLGNQLHSQPNSRLHTFGTTFWGSWDAYWIAYFQFPPRHLQSDFYDAESTALLNQWDTLARSCGLIYPLEKVCFVCDRPTRIAQDRDNRLHHEDGMALAFSDGWGLYRWHGVQVPEDVILRPETITVAQIETEVNAEVRRIMIERMGIERFSAEAMMETVDEIAEFGARRHPVRLLRWRSNARSAREDVYVVCVKNATPESDGTFKDYFLEVDPTAYNGDAGRYAHAAVASTWRRALPSGDPEPQPYFRNWRDYQPDYET